MESRKLIAALTRGTLVVEAEHRSGSLATARWALRLGRCAMGLPGPVTSALSAGVHELLRGEGALVTDAAEVIELHSGARFSTRTMDLGPGGCFVDTTVPFPVEIDLSVPGSSQVHCITA